VFLKLFHFFNKFVSVMLERDGHEMDKKLTFSISQTKKKKKKNRSFSFGSSYRPVYLLAFRFGNDGTKQSSKEQWPPRR
jgi:hypothetical protein